jgi:hypothetical protein
MKSPAGIVSALFTSSLGLPGMQDLLAAELPEESLDYRFTRYDENALPKSKLLAGDPSRYEIDSHQLRWVKNLDSSYTLTVGYLHEAMSGSSPWYVIPGSSGQALQVMSGATIREKRDQLDVSISRLGESITHTLGAGYSTEDDYQAIYGSYSGKKESEDALTTVNWGFSYSDDELNPTDAVLFGRIIAASKDSKSASLGLSQVINRNAVFQAGATLTHHSGFLSDPYKLVLVGPQVLPDQRPDERTMFSVSTRFRQYIESSRAALQLDYRYFRDSWEIQAHTLDLAYVQPLGSAWELTPSVRYHAQKAPDFYAPYFLEIPQYDYWSSDYRLATFGALSYRLDLSWKNSRLRASAGLEIYDSEPGLSVFGNPQDTPGLVDFWRASLALKITL